MTKEEIRTAYSQFLSDEGYQFVVDKEGDIVFRHDDRQYILPIKEDDPQYFQVLFIVDNQVESDEEWHNVQQAALAATLKTKCAKVIPFRHRMAVSGELFLTAPDALDGEIFKRVLSSMTAAMVNFVKSLKG